MIVVLLRQEVDLAENAATILVDEAPGIAKRHGRERMSDHALLWCLNKAFLRLRYEDLAQKRALKSPAMRT